MTNTDCRSVPVSYAVPAAIQALETAHEYALIFEGDPVEMINETLQEHPDFIMAHCFKAAMLSQAMETRIYDDFSASVTIAESLWDKANERERFHINAVKAWREGDFFGAVQHWEKALTQYPFDLLALQMVHLTDVLLGDVAGQRDCVARVFILWDESMPGYEFVLGFFSFGLEENRDFSRAEELGRQSLAIRINNPYAVHAVAHVMEMKGRQSGGISFMEYHRKNWSKTNFANHLWWHLSLFHLDNGNISRVLDIYDAQLRSSEQSSDKYSELDAAALLWRLKLLDIDDGGRWADLADKWEASAADTLYAFNDVHAMMAFVADNRRDAAETLINANARYVEHASDANVAMSRDMGLPFCLALQDFANGKYADCVKRLMPLRYKTYRLGGSFAQRDIIGWTLLEASLRARNFHLGLSLANERCSLKPTSGQNWRYIARAHKGLAGFDRARYAEAQANALLVG